MAMDNPLRALKAEANGVVQHAEEVGAQELSQATLKSASHMNFGCDQPASWQ